MLRFECDYTEGCIPEILEAIALHNHAQYPGYSEDACTERARARMKALCGREDIAVHFLVGGTQANTTVIAAALRHHQGVIAAATGHIACHETGAVEAAGHKVIALPSETGRLSAQQIEKVCAAHWSDPSFEHQTQPAMVYLSHPAENGTIYSLSELREIRAVCDKWHLKLFLDGARLGYGLAAPDSDVTVQDLAQLTDVFYLGGTKVGALFGEAVVITDPELAVDFRYHIKQRGGMLAKGWLLGLQFDVLLENDRYMTISRKAVAQAMRIKKTLTDKGISFWSDSNTNQLFPILPNQALLELEKTYVFNHTETMDETHTAVRICTSWATTDEQVDALVADIQRVLA